MQTKWLIPIDGSRNSESAVNYAFDKMDKEKDSIYLLTVVDDESLKTYYYGTLKATEVMKEIQTKKENAAKVFLNKVAKQLIRENVKHLTLLLGISNEVGDAVVKAVETHNIDTCVVGRRGMGQLKKSAIGSVSSYVVQHAPCDVIVVKGYHGPKEIHESNVSAVKIEEELERLRRMEQLQKEEIIENEKRAVESLISKNYTITQEEEERRRRIAEEKELEQKEEENKKAEKMGVIIQEEEERKRRIAEMKKEEKKEMEKREFDSKMNRKISFFLEEDERKSRIEEEKASEKKEAEKKVAEKIGVIIQEEEERKRRLESLGIQVFIYQSN